MAWLIVVFCLYLVAMLVAIVLIEYRAEDPSVPIKPLHKMSEAQARTEFEAVGLVWERTGDFLPQQHFLVFRKPE